jgi:hypothetical protein
VHGRAAIPTCLRRAGPTLPYGVAAVLRHAVGGDLGGGYECRSDSPAGVGVNALALDASGLITFPAVWDGGSLGEESLSSLATMAVEPWPPS